MFGARQKVVYYEPAGRIHSSQWELIDNPPEGYKFVTKKISPIVNNDFIFDKVRLQILDRLMPLNLVKAKLDSLLRMPKADIIFAYNHVVFRKMPWVVLVEWANILAGRDLRFFPRYKDRIERMLSSEYCRGIVTWTSRAKESMLRSYNTKGFEDKIRVIPHAVRRTEYVRNYKRNSLNLLFVGSINTPEDFNAKGAADAIEAFRILRAKYKDLKLTIRARTPKIESTDGLTIISRILPKPELRRLFEDADIFVLPSHYAQETVIIEAMSYGLPVITSWMNSSWGEYVKNGSTGIVLPKPDGMEYFTDDMMLISETIYRHKLVRHAYNDLGMLVSSLEGLIENPSLRERLGRNAKAEVDEGRFSIEYRDKLLKEVLEG